MATIILVLSPWSTIKQESSPFCCGRATDTEVNTWYGRCSKKMQEPPLWWNRILCGHWSHNQQEAPLQWWQRLRTVQSMYAHGSRNKHVLELPPIPRIKRLPCNKICFGMATNPKLEYGHGSWKINRKLPQNTNQATAPGINKELLWDGHWFQNKQEVPL